MIWVGMTASMAQKRIAIYLRVSTGEQTTDIKIGFVCSAAQFLRHVWYWALPKSSAGSTFS
jgi:hypothetical protein